MNLARKSFPFVSEDQLHRSIAQYLRLKHPRLLWFHCPNGGSRNEIEGAKLKAMGTLAGVPDLIFFLPGGKAACMEVKAAKGSLSISQKAFLERAENVGVPWALVRSIEDVADTLSGWGVA